MQWQCYKNRWRWQLSKQILFLWYVTFYIKGYIHHNCIILGLSNQIKCFSLFLISLWYKCDVEYCITELWFRCMFSDKVITSVTYLDIFEQYIFVESNRIEREEEISLIVREAVNNTFPGGRIERNGPIIWLHTRTVPL